MAKRMGMAQTPHVYIDTRLHALQSVASGETKEGVPYIVVTSEFLNRVPADQQRSLIAFEMDRLKHRDGSPENQAAQLNDSKLADARTYEADHNASGPLGNCHPKCWLPRYGPLMTCACRAYGQPVRSIPGPDPDHPYAGLRIDQLLRQKTEQDARGVCRGR